MIELTVIFVFDMIFVTQIFSSCGLLNIYFAGLLLIDVDIRLFKMFCLQNEMITL